MADLMHWRCPSCGGLASTDGAQGECGPCGGRFMDRLPRRAVVALVAALTSGAESERGMANIDRQGGTAETGHTARQHQNSPKGGE